MLDKNEEQQLIKAAQAGSDAAKTKLYLAYERFLNSQARRYANSTVSHDDLMQHAAVGFLEAIDNYDLSRSDSVSLITFAKHRITSHIFDCINTMHRDFRLFTTKPLRKAFSNIARYRDGSHHLSPEKRKQMAEELNIKEEDILGLEKRLYSERVCLHDTVGDEGGLYSDIITDDSFRPEDDVSDDDYQIKLKRSIASALSNLDSRSRDIIVKRMLPEDGQKATLKELGIEFGVKPQRIEQLQKKAFASMKEQLKHMN